MAAAPDVVVEIHSPGDEAYEKLEFYGKLGVPEVWIIHRESKQIDLYPRQGGAWLEKQAADADCWAHSPGTGVSLKPCQPRQARAAGGA